MFWSLLKSVVRLATWCQGGNSGPGVGAKEAPAPSAPPWGLRAHPSLVAWSLPRDSRAWRAWPEPAGKVLSWFGGRWLGRVLVGSVIIPLSRRSRVCPDRL